MLNESINESDYKLPGEAYNARRELEKTEFKEKVKEHVDQNEEYLEKKKQIEEADLIVTGMIWDTSGGLLEWAIRNNFIEDNFYNNHVLTWNVGWKNLKIRNGFFTNSSSSSFIISKKHLDKDQIEAIWKHDELGGKLGIDWSEERWSITENSDYITGYTWMDNFDMYTFLEKIDVNMNDVKWSEHSFDLSTYGQKKNWSDLLYED